MDSSVLFVVSTVAVAAVYLLVRFKSISKAKRYLTKDRAGKGILKGIVYFILFGIVVVILTLGSSKVFGSEYQEGTWFSYGEVYLGIEFPKNTPSPQCVPSPDGVDDQGTSNGGLRLNFYESYDSRFHANFKYTHHSCALNEDRNHYDAFGFEMIYRFYSR